MTANDTTQMAGDCAADMPGDLTRMDNLDDWEIADGYTDPRGFDVMGRDDDKIGSIDALLASPSAGMAYFAIVKAGGWFSSKQFAIPLTMIRLRDGKAYIPFTKEQFQNAPEWQDDEPMYEQHCAYWQRTPRMNAEGAEAAYAAAETGRLESAPLDTESEVRVPVSEESVNVSKTMRPEGYITLRKREQQYTKHINEPVTHTDVSVETRDVKSGETFDQGTPTLKEGETLRIPVMEEQLNVETTPEQVTREVVIEAKPRTENVEKDITLNREVVDVDEEGNVNVIPPRQGQAPGVEARR